MSACNDHLIGGRGLKKLVKAGKLESYETTERLSCSLRHLLKHKAAIVVLRELGISY